MNDECVAVQQLMQLKVALAMQQQKEQQEAKA
jgi:hypothetical protein